MKNCLCFIGGSGLYDLEFLDNIEYLNLSSSMGNPSDNIIKGIQPSAVTSRQVTWHLCFQFHGRCHQIIKDNTKRVESQKYGQPIKSFFSFDFFGNNHGLRVIKKQLNETR